MECLKGFCWLLGSNADPIKRGPFSVGSGDIFFPKNLRANLAYFYLHLVSCWPQPASISARCASFYATT
jgi:hypothetical protein